MKKIFLLICMMCLGISASFASDSSDITPQKKISNTFESMKTGIPSELLEDVRSRVDEESDIFGFGHAYYKRIGTATGQMKAYLKAKDKLNTRIKKEAENFFKEFLTEHDEYTKTLVKPALRDLVKRTVDMCDGDITQKGAWEDDKKVYTLAVIDRATVKEHAVSTFAKFLDNMSENITKARDSL